MKKLFLTALVISAGLLSALSQTTEDRKDRIIASYLIAFGILPQDGETSYWMNDPLSAKSVTELVNEHKKNIRNNASLADRAILHSYQDAMGRSPRANEYQVWRPLKLSYIELMDRHMKFLRDYPDAFTEVIRLSYRNELKREAQPQEINNWKSWGVRSYASIIQEHQKNLKAGMFSNGKLPGTKVSTDKKSGVVFQPSSKVSDEVIRFASSNVIVGSPGTELEFAL